MTHLTLPRTSTVAPIFIALGAACLLSACVGDEDWIEFDMRQRSTMVVMDLDYDCRVKIGDIERGSRVDDVRILDEEDDATVFSAETLREGDTRDFTWRGTPYRFHVLELRDGGLPDLNDPYPQDHGTFAIERVDVPAEDAP